MMITNMIPLMQYEAVYVHVDHIFLYKLKKLGGEKLSYIHLKRETFSIILNFRKQNVLETDAQSNYNSALFTVCKLK